MAIKIFLKLKKNNDNLVNSKLIKKTLIRSSNHVLKKRYKRQWMPHPPTGKWAPYWWMGPHEGPNGEWPDELLTFEWDAFW